MAVSDVFNSLTFGDINSLDYGVYITGSGVFDAPERAVEMVEVPGRNGAVDLDAGYWNNIPVTYTAGTFATDEEEFSQKIKAFRNAILSQIGYKRLTDTYNPGEYRLGLYSAGLVATPANRNQAGEFQLVFNCKPQRFLLSGEQEVTVRDGSILTNPTLYDASPLIVGKYIAGTLEFNGYRIEFLDDNPAVGKYEAAPRMTWSELSKTIDVDLRLANTGDVISSDGLEWDFAVNFAVGTYSMRQQGSGFDATAEFYGGQAFTVRLENLFFAKGTAESKSVEILCNGTRSFSITIQFDGTSQIAIEQTGEGLVAPSVLIEKLICNSTFEGNDEFIVDTEIGEAYKIVEGKRVDMNQHVVIGLNLPKLGPGLNEISFAGSADEIKIAPRWWQL